MAATRLIFGFLFVIVVLVAFFLGLSVQSKSATIDEATALGATVDDYLGAIDKRCSARDDDFAVLDACLSEVLTELEQAGEMELEDFENAGDEDGYVIVTNEGRMSLASANFTLLLNRDVVDQGCTVQGDIDPGYACRLDFSQECTAGDNLEILYNDERAYLRTC